MNLKRDHFPCLVVDQDALTFFFLCCVQDKYSFRSTHAQTNGQQCAIYEDTDINK